MLKIRLARTGKKKQAHYRVVVADQRKAVQAKFVEILGWFNPHTKELNIDKAKVEGWLSKGANPSNTLAILLEKNGFKLPPWVEIEKKSKPPKAKKKEAKAPATKPEEKAGEGEEGKPAEEIEKPAEEAKEEAKAEETEKSEVTESVAAEASTDKEAEEKDEKEEK